MGWLRATAPASDGPWNEPADLGNAGLEARVARAQAELADLAVVLKAPDHPATQRQIVWGSKVSLKFKLAVLWIEEQIALDADKLMSCMAFESSCTFSPSIRNAAGSSAVGLIQFMKATARQLGTTTEALAAMDAVAQLSYVYHYFRQFGSDFSHWTLEDVYMAILFPGAIGKPLEWVMPWKYGSLAYKQNSGLDLNKDQKITKAEASAGVQKMYRLGQQFRG